MSQNHDIEKLKQLMPENTRADCYSCHWADFDADPGVYAACQCAKLTGTGYHCVEDLGIEPGTEKNCWFPHFWISKAADNVKTIEDQQRQFEIFEREIIEPFRAQYDRGINVR